MSKTYAYNPKEYFTQITFIGMFCAAVFVLCIVMCVISELRLLFGFVALVAGYTVFNTFVSRSNPSEVILEEDGISFAAYGKAVKYRFEDITSFRAKDFQMTGKIFLRVNKSSLFQGRYWINTARFNDGAELFLYLLRLEHQTHPDSLKAKAWESTRPGEDKTPVLPWQIQPGEDREIKQ